jgi:hypothetical protein
MEYNCIQSYVKALLEWVNTPVKINSDGYFKLSDGEWVKVGPEDKRPVFVLKRPENPDGTHVK